MNKVKSAKDIAFDKERSKIRSEIKMLKSEIKILQCEISELKVTLSEKENEIAEKDDWIERLLEYMDLSEDDLKKLIEKEKTEYDLIQKLNDFGKLYSTLRNYARYT